MISPAAAVRNGETASSSGLVLRMKPAHPASVAATSIESSAAAVSTTMLALGSDRTEVGDRVDTQAVGQMIVEEHHVRRGRRHHVLGLRQRGGRTDDLEVRLGRDSASRRLSANMPCRSSRQWAAWCGGVARA